MDGQTIYIPRNKLKLIREVNEQLTRETTLVIEEIFYSKMIVRDVNSYIAVYDDSTKEHEHLKLKGAYEIDKEYHKDPSMRIVPLAVKDYFVYGTSIIETIKNHKDIFDFCLLLKINSTSTAVIKELQKDGTIKEYNLDRTTRYYINNTGKTCIVKQFDENRASGVNVGYSVQLFNQFEKKENFLDYKVDYNFYISEARKLIDAIEDKQLTLF